MVMNEIAWLEATVEPVTEQADSSGYVEPAELPVYETELEMPVIEVTVVTVDPMEPNEQDDQLIVESQPVAEPQIDWSNFFTLDDFLNPDRMEPLKLDKHGRPIVPDFVHSLPRDDESNFVIIGHQENVDLPDTIEVESLDILWTFNDRSLESSGFDPGIYGVFEEDGRSRTLVDTEHDPFSLLV